MDKLMVKVINFVSVGATVWVAYPNLYQVHVYAPDAAVQQLGLDDTLTGDTASPGFELKLSQLFAPFMKD
jgi:Uma2 family endonuclease